MQYRLDFKRNNAYNANKGGFWLWCELVKFINKINGKTSWVIKSVELVLHWYNKITVKRRFHWSSQNALICKLHVDCQLCKKKQLTNKSRRILSRTQSTRILFISDMQEFELCLLSTSKELFHYCLDAVCSACCIPCIGILLSRMFIAQTNSKLIHFHN